MTDRRDHGGGLDAAIAQYGGTRATWLDLSTGINPSPYPIGTPSADAWRSLPDAAASARLELAARQFWGVPKGAEVVIAPGASALIARMPDLFCKIDHVYIPGPTYNEHAAAFRNAGRDVIEAPSPNAALQITVHPNNPTGCLLNPKALQDHTINVIDESFCDVTPNATLVRHANKDGIVILKSFGKFWGLAGLRLGFAICTPALAEKMRELLGPWPVSGPAIEIGAQALEDLPWATLTRERLSEDAARLDALVKRAGGTTVGGTPLFRLYNVDDANQWQDRLARNHVWSRVFPYSKTWLRLGLPDADRWDQLQATL